MDHSRRGDRRSVPAWLAILMVGIGSVLVVSVLALAGARTAGPVPAADTRSVHEPITASRAPEPVPSVPEPSILPAGPDRSVEERSAKPPSPPVDKRPSATAALSALAPTPVPAAPPATAGGIAGVPAQAVLPPNRGATMSRGVPVAEIDVDRLLALTPLRPAADNRHADGQGRFTRDGERMRFDAEGDWLSLMDRLSIPGNGDVEIAFEIEFDATREGAPDVTAFWNAGPHESRGNGPITGSWSGYELKLGGPGRDAMAFKEGGWAIVRDRQPVFTQGVPHQVEIRQQGGRVSVTVDGNPVLNAVDPDPGAQTWSADQQRGFGLMFWHASGWVGPIQIRTPEGNG